VGPNGSYFTTEHTLQHFRQEGWFPKLIDQDRYDNWVESGKKTMLERGIELAKKILANHEVAPLAQEVKKEIESILTKAREREK
jgi:trimethylamine--corrinoid protein Co-methyltransferase